MESKMDPKERIGKFLQKLLTDYGLKQRDLAPVLGVGLGSLAAYLHGKELPRLEIIMKIADIGGVTLDDLLKTDKSPMAKTIAMKTGSRSIAVAGDITGGNIHTGDVYNNTPVRKVFLYTYEPGDLTEEQAAKIQDLVNQVVEMEVLIKKQPKTHAAVYGAMKKHFKVAYYRRIGEDRFDQAVAYLQMWMGRLKRAPSYGKKAPGDKRKDRYKAIHSAARNELRWSTEQLRSYIFEHFKVSSMTDLGDRDLEHLYNRIMGLKKTK